MNRSDLSHQVRAALKRLPPPYASHYGVVPYPPPAVSPSILPVARECQSASTALARLETLVSELGDPWLVSRILMRREAVSGSAIEGTNSTLDELLAAEETGNAAGHEAAIQVKDYAFCLDAGVPDAIALGPSIFSAGLVRGLHRSVMKSEGGYADTPGEPRANVVWIGGRGDIAYSTYNPAPPQDIGRCLADNIAYMRGEADEVFPPSLLTRMAVAHAHFEAVHPFTDGNGRVGRLLLPLMMAAQGHTPLYLSPYIDAHPFGTQTEFPDIKLHHPTRRTSPLGPLRCGPPAQHQSGDGLDRVSTTRVVTPKRGLDRLRRRWADHHHAVVDDPPRPRHPAGMADGQYRHTQEPSQ